MPVTSSLVRIFSTSLVLGGMTLASVADARTLSYAIGYPPGSDSAKAAQNYADRVAEFSDGELSVKVYPLSLLNFAETSAGVRDGMADIGYLLSPYFPAEYPHTNLLAEAAMQLQLFGDEIKGKEGPAYIGALAEFVFFNCEECHEDFQKQNQVFTGIASSSNYMLNCSKPVTTVEDLAGKRLRAAGSQWSRWAQKFGASPVTLSGNEAYEALDQGVVDCVVISAPDLENLGIIEATTDITTDMPGGVFAGAEITNTNRDAWQSLNDKQRTAMLHAGAYISAEIPWVYHQREAAVLERAQNEMGIEIHTASPELQEATREFVRQDMDAIALYYEKTYGVENGAELLASFRPVLEKWVELVKDVNSQEELAELYWDEVFSKVDASTHGM